MDCFTLAQHDQVRKWFALPSLQRLYASGWNVDIRRLQLRGDTDQLGREEAAKAISPVLSHPTPIRDDAVTLRQPLLPSHSLEAPAKTQLQQDASKSSRRSAIRGFLTLGVLNLPIFIGYLVLNSRKMAQSSYIWKRWSEKSIAGRYLSYPLEYIGFKRWFIRVHFNSSAHIGEIRKFKTLFPFQATSFADGRYWTFLTSTFTHIDPKHFLGNMVFLWQIAPICAQTPGLNSLHIFVVTVISSLASSMAFTAHITYFPPTRNPWIASQSMAMGFSGVNMAFLAVAVLSSPWNSITGIPAPFPVPCWALGGFLMLSDAYGLLQIMGLVPRAKWAPKMGEVGHAAHLASFLTGGLYYMLFLRPGTSMPSPEVPSEEKASIGVKELRREGCVLGEQGESDSALATR